MTSKQLNNNNELQLLLARVRACKLCEHELPLGANPVVRAARSARILIVGQAPGTRVHKTSIPWNDPSGDRLRSWMQIDKSQFYNEEDIAIIPMGFCYPGKGNSGDLPPRKECAKLWHQELLDHLPYIQLTLLIGQYAQRYYLANSPYKTVTEQVRHWQQFIPAFLPLPHPSPRNQFWLKKNNWFEVQVLPYLQERVSQVLTGSGNNVKK